MWSGRLAAGRARLPAVRAAGEGLADLSDAQIAAKTGDLRARHDNGESLDSLLPESFAVCREAATRALGMRHFDEQILGGMALFSGCVAEMKTGEGKTLVATLPACLQALGGKTHIVTVNDYLARRDAEWMGAVYRFLGLDVGINLSSSNSVDKRAAYACPIVYGTNNQFGFDYLRDNMRFGADDRLQTGLDFAIVDEVDSILIDEARVPLIISGEASDSVEVYRTVAVIAAGFEKSDGPAPDLDSPLSRARQIGEGETPRGDFVIDEKTRQAHLTEAGYEKAERVFAREKMMRGESLYDTANLGLLHHLTAALKARHLYLRDRDYVVQEGEAVLVDEFTGRLMPGRRLGEGQHQAIEAKEGITVQRENQTLASTSFQNYFRLYRKIAGMTGTASTEAEEFRFIYNLEVLQIPTHRKMIRDDQLDRVYRTAAGKTRAIIEDIKAARARGQPALVGTASIDASEKLSALLAAQNVAHEVLNAKQHAREATIIAQAGAPGAVTIATNMAGRGTDIVLGGNIDAQKAAVAAAEDLPETDKAARIEALEAKWREAHETVVAAGGLRILGAERNESRRVDNQLRGRAGRQGDPGSSAFYLSFEDSLLRVFAAERVSRLMERLQIDEDEAIESKLVTRTIENAQRKVEAHNFDIRRQLLQFDDIANDQRRIVYEQREQILTAPDIDGIARDFRLDSLAALGDEYLPPETPEEDWRLGELTRVLAGDYRLSLTPQEWLAADSTMSRDALTQKIRDEAEKSFAQKTTTVAAEPFSRFMRSVILNVVDGHWRGHLSALENLRQSVGWRGHAQKNPLQEYRRESFEMFNRMLDSIKSDIARVLYALTIREEAPPAPPPAMIEAPPPPRPTIDFDAAETGILGETTRARTDEMPRKVGRNTPCPCGSGKKYKHCHGKL